MRNKVHKLSPQINGFRQTESVYLERFFRNLLLNEKWDLRNRNLHIHPTEEWNEQPNIVGKPTDYPTITQQVESQSQYYGIDTIYWKQRKGFKGNNDGNRT